MEFKGTKGPWSVKTGITLNGISSKDNQLAVIQGKNRDANAKLISKAPEMLEMLKGVLSDIDSGNYPNGEWKYDEIYSLIKEATEL
jgi:hypothetical protein